MLTFAQNDSGSSGSGIVEQLNILHNPQDLLDLLSQMHFIIAAMIVTVGVLCIFNGYRWHKWVIAVLAFLCGIWLGYQLSQQMDKSVVVATSVGFLCAIIATPLLRLSVMVFGGITGAFIGANTWSAMPDAPVDAHWAGALIGFIVIAMASLVLFRLVVVLFTSVGGAAMVIFGGLTLLMHVPDWKPSIEQSLSANKMLIPLLMLLAAVGGFVIQESRLRANGVSILGKESPPKPSAKPST